MSAPILLLVEDSPSQAAQFKFHFESLGYQIHLAHDYVKALKLLDQLNASGKIPDIIVLDFLLPGQNGAELCRQIKKDVRLKAVPVLMVSVENTLAAITEAYAAGASYFVVKGVKSLHTVERLIRLILGSTTLAFSHPSFSNVTS